jgi:hypothetical protein
MLLLKANLAKPLSIQLPPNSKWLVGGYILIDADISVFTPSQISDYSIITISDATAATLTALDYTIQDDGQVRKLTTGPTPLSAPLDGSDLDNYMAGAKYLSKLNAAASYNTQYNALPNSESMLEQSTWSQQLAEATAYTADNTVATPLLSVLAPTRNETVAQYAADVIAAAAAYDTARNTLLAALKSQYQSIDNTTAASDLKNLGWI